VLAIDIDTAKIDALRRAEIPIHEQGLESLVREGLDSGRLAFSTSIDDIGDIGIVLLCLQTPPSNTGAPDTTFLKKAVADLKDRVRPGTVLITKSTVPVGTQTAITGWLDRSDVSVVSNPEFLREGLAVSDFLKPDRVIIGADDEHAAQVTAGLYQDLATTIQITDPASAELIKYAANAFLATKISFVNEIARLSHRVNANIDDVAQGLGSDARIGASYLSPGPGWGGSCFPKDVLALQASGQALDVPLAVIDAALESNKHQFDHVVERVVELCAKPLDQATIAVWGLSFKAGTDDTRVSPSLEIIERLRSQSATVRAHDPEATVGTEVAETGGMYEICRDADLLIVATEWPVYASADPTQVVSQMATPTVFDTRNIVDLPTWLAAGLTVARVGRQSLSRLD